MGEIRKDNLHESLIKELNELANIDLSGKQDKTDESLLTESKDVIGAINELFQSANNGKELIANAIGEPLDSNDTFSAMSNKINNMKSDLKQVLTDEGVSVSSTDTIASLITKVDNEFTKDNNTISEMEANNVTNRQNLITALRNNGKELTGNESFEELVGMVEVKNGIIVSPYDIKQIACGYNHTVILKNDGSLWSSGQNSYGQLGLGDTTNRTVFTKVTTNINNDVKQIACIGDQTFILKNDGSVWCCGYNSSGELGLNDKNYRNTFTQVTVNINNDVKQIACGGNHTFILKNDGSVWSCGYNEYGQLGLNDTTNRTVFTKVTTNINNDVKQIACGYNHTFILKNDGSVWGSGYNKLGHLGLNDKTNRNTFTKVTTNINNDVKQVSCGGDHTFILKNDGSIYSCGQNSYGRLGLNDTTNRTAFTQVTTNINNDVKQIACGNTHTFILKNDGSVWGCGRNNNGELGLNSTTQRNVFNQATANINNDVKQIACGDYHTFIIKNDGSLWSCGNNGYGQLGLNDTTRRTTFTQTLKTVSLTVTFD